ASRLAVVERELLVLVLELPREHAREAELLRVVEDPAHDLRLESGVDGLLRLADLADDDRDAVSPRVGDEVRASPDRGLVRVSVQVEEVEAEAVELSREDVGRGASPAGARRDLDPGRATVDERGLARDQAARAVPAVGERVAIDHAHDLVDDVDA